MEAAVAVAKPRQAPPEPEPSHDGAAEATRSGEELFQWSGYVHVGPGAAECEHAIDGACTDRRHFHAWVCLPNQFQIRDITDKARAAKARKVRALRDPESDSFAVLEAELETDQREHFEELKRGVAEQEVQDRIVDIVREVDDDERFENHAQDAEELQRLQGVKEDERDAEEYSRLQAEALAYSQALQDAVKQATDAEVIRLNNTPPDEVVEMERRRRIENLATELYLHTYYTWTMYVCARKPSLEGFSTARVFKAPEELKNAAPEVVIALRAKIRDLEHRTAVRGDAAGNS